jgi:hypothetical protein
MAASVGKIIAKNRNKKQQILADVDTVKLRNIRRMIINIY